MDSELKERGFLAAQESPGSWLVRAINLRAAADRLDPLKYPPGDDEPLSFSSEYQFLFGLAFENLLKGFISLVRLESRLTPALPVECHIHRLEILAIRPECAQLALTTEELGTLSRLSAYITWAGRYPIPKRSPEMVALHHGSREHKSEKGLWDRVMPLLYTRAWVMKGGPKSMGGYKLYIERGPSSNLS